MKSLPKQYLFAITGLIAVIATITLIYINLASASPQPQHDETIEQCQGLTKHQCIALLEQQVATARLKLNIMWEQRQ